MGKAQPKLERGSVEWNNEMYLKHPTPDEGWLVRWVNSRRVTEILNYANVTENDDVLELGCESGALTEKIPACRKIVGLDISSAALGEAKKRLRLCKHPVDFIQQDAQKQLPFNQGEFSTVISSEMLEHVVDPRAVLEQIHSICNEETKVVISIPIERPKLFVKKVLNALGVMKWLLPNIEVGQSEWHIHKFSKKKFIEISSDLFEIVKSKNILWNHYVFLLKKKGRNATVPPLARYARKKRIEFFSPSISPSDSILEIGAGSGWFLEHLKQKGCSRCYSLDLKPPADFVGDIRDWRSLGIEPSSFDVIVAFELLEHVDCIKECLEILKPGGRLIATTPVPPADFLLRAMEAIGLNQRRTSPHSNLVWLKNVDGFSKKKIKLFFGMSQFAVLTK